jgi:methylglyoxal synthase
MTEYGEGSDMKTERGQQKTLISLLASHDHVETNNKLATALERFCCLEQPQYRERIDQFHFLITFGTFFRVIQGDEESRKRGIKPVSDPVRDFLLPRTTVLPSGVDGGVTILSYFITQQKCNIIWPFFSPLTSHWLTPENLALMRLCDQWHVKRLMNTGSVDEWFNFEADRDADRNLQACPPSITLGEDANGKPACEIPAEKWKNTHRISIPTSLKMPRRTEDTTIALIAHDEMKPRMVDFAIDNEHVLARFKRILTTGTTGQAVANATHTLSPKIYRYHSGPKGGDIEIATEILFGRCHIVVFFIDPLHSHAHIEDIRVVFGACMIQDHVRMLTNEMQAREWIERVARRKSIELTPDEL